MGKKHTYEEAYNIFLENGYELLEKEYKGSGVKMRYRCPNHPDEETYIRLSDLKNGVKCPFVEVWLGKILIM